MSTNFLTLLLQEVKLNSFLFECGAQLSDVFLINRLLEVMVHDIHH